MPIICEKHCIRSIYFSALTSVCFTIVLFMFGLQLVLIKCVLTRFHLHGCLWHISEKKKNSIPHMHVHNTHMRHVRVCLCVNRTEWGSGQVALTLHCLGPSRATDPVSNSPLLAVLMWATRSHHTICSEERPALLRPTHAYTITSAGLYKLYPAQIFLFLTPKGKT